MKDRNVNSNCTPAMVASILVLFVACMCLVSCIAEPNNIYDESGQAIVKTSTLYKKPIDVCVFTDGGHTYRAYRMSGGESIWGGVVHDPDCKCTKRQ